MLGFIKSVISDETAVRHKTRRGKPKTPVPAAIPLVSAAVVMALEPRFMFDAAGAATAADHTDKTAADKAAADAHAQAGADGQTAQAKQTDAVTLDKALADVTAPAAGNTAAADAAKTTTARAVAVNTQATAIQAAAPSGYTEVKAVDPSLNDGKKEVAFIESNVAGVQTLIDGVKPGIEVVVLDAGKDGLTQMAAWAESHTGYDAIHVISHGEDGSLHLGSVDLTDANLMAHQAELSALGSALTSDGDLLLYGCNIAADGKGITFIGDLASLTGADVAASTDRTGAAALGGNWIFERTTGTIDSKLALTDYSRDHYAWLLTSADLVASNSGETTLTGGSSSIFTVKSTTNLTNGDYDPSTGNNFILTLAGADIFVINSFDVTTDKFDVTYWGYDTTTTGPSHTFIAASGADAEISHQSDPAVSSDYYMVIVGNGYQLTNGEIVNHNGKAGTGGVPQDLTGAVSGTIVFFVDQNAFAQSIVFLPGISSDQLSTSNFIYETPIGTAPTLTTTGGTPTSANGAAVSLFSGTNADDQDNGTQTFTDLKLTVSNVADTTEYLKIGNVDVALTAATSGLSLGTNNGSATVTMNGTTATVSITGMALSNGDMNTLVNDITYHDNTAATAGARTVTLTRVTDSGHISTTLSAAATVTVTVPTAPAIGHLNGDSVAWVDASTAVTLDSGTNATASDADFGSGAWTNGSLTVQRSGTAWSADTFGFTGASGFSISGGNLWSGATTIIGTATNTDGMLSVTFNGNSTTALVTSLLQSITYLNATPAGNATIRFTLTDDTSLSATADVTVTTDNIYVTNTTDTTTANLTDGVSFSEAMAIANSQSGTQTLILAGGFAGGTRTLAGNLAVGDNVIVDADLAGGMTLSGYTITVASGTTLTFNNGASDTLTVASVLADGGTTSALAKTGAGTLTLTGTNTRTGTTSITGGVLSVAADSNLDGGTGTIMINGGKLAVTASSNTTIDNAVTIGAGGGTIDVGSATGSQSVTFSGAFTSAVNVDLTKTGAGNLQLTGATNSTTMLGGITVSGGNLSLGGGATDAMLANGTITLNGGGLLTSGLNGLTIDNAISLGAGNGTVTVNGNTNTITLSGIIGGTGSLTKAAGGTLALSGANTYSGGTTVSAGTLRGDATSLQGNITDNAAVEFSQSADGTYAGVISGTGALTKSGGAKLTLTGVNTYTGATTISAGTLALNNSGGTALSDSSAVTVTGTLALSTNETIGSLSGAGNITLGANTLTANQTADLAYSGAMSGTGGLTKTGSGELELSGANTYTGATTVSVGTLSVSNANGIAATSATTIASGATLRLQQVNVSVGSLAGAGTVTLNGGSLTAGGDNTSTEFSGIIGVMSGGGLTKTGTGTLTLSGTNTYSGSTAVSAGTLSVIGALNGTSSVSVASGATLAGTGSIFAAASTNTLTVNSGGYLAPATVGTTGQLTVNGNLVLNGTLKLDLAGGTVGTQYDQVVVSGSVTLGAGSALDATYTASGSNNTFIVIDKTGAGAISGTIGGSVAEGGTLTSNSRQYKVSYVGGSGNDLTLQGNSPPTFTSTAATLVNEDAPYSYTVTTSDSDGDTVTVTATTLPSWLKFENGVLSGTPGSGDVGNHTVVLTATDAGGAVATQTFTITVGAVNQPPVFTSTPPTTDTVGTAYRYTPVAIDPEGKAVSFTATTLPPWLSFTNGVLSGTPGGGDAGNHTVVLTATDADGKTLTQTFTITVRTTTPPLNINQVTTSTTTTPTGNATTGTTIGSPTTITFPTSGSSISAVLGTSDTGGAYTTTILAGNVNGNTSSATGIQQIQGLTSTVTSSNASASADGSVLVRNAAGGNNNAISSFYGSGTIVSNGVMGGSAGNAGLNTGTTTSFGASGWGGGLGGGSAGALGGSGFGGIGANGVTGAWTGGTGKAAGNRAGNIPGSGNTPQNGDVRGNPQGDNAQGNARGGNIQENTQGRSPQDSGPPPTEGRPQNNVPKTGTGNEAEPQTWLPLQNLDFSGVDDFHDGFTTRLAGIANAFDTQSTRLDAALAFLERAA